jgi:hypothetical protein
MKDGIKVNNRNLKRSLKAILPKLEYGQEYDGDTVNKYGNEVSPEYRYRFDRIPISQVQGDLDYDIHKWSYYFLGVHSKELREGTFRGKHNDLMCVIEYMIAYEDELPVAPIAVYGNQLDDGNHRLYAQFKLGRGIVDAFVRLD